MVGCFKEWYILNPRRPSPRSSSRLEENRKGGALPTGYPKTRLTCRSDGRQATRNLAVPRKQIRARFLAPLGMTRERVCPQNVKARLFQGAVRNPAWPDSCVVSPGRRGTQVTRVLSDLQLAKVRHAGLHQRQIHLDKVVLDSTRLCCGEDLLPVEAILAYRCFFA